MITTDGTTLLGSDDKAGVAAIMQAVEEIQKEDVYKRQTYGGIGTIYLWLFSYGKAG